jgi:hypothetical protein
LTLEEDEAEGPAGDFRAGDWRRDLKVKHLKKARARLKAKIKNVAETDDLAALRDQWREIHHQLEELSAV